MPHLRMIARIGAAIVLCVVLVAPASAASKGYSTGFTRWRAAANGFTSWARQGVVLANGALQLDLQTAASGSDPYAPGSYFGQNFYNGGSFRFGEATSPEMPAGIDFTQAIASWNALTPAGSWIETQIRAQIGARWTKWYNLGVWAADGSTIRRHSVNQQADADGTVAVDTLMLSQKKSAASAFQLKVRLFSTGAAAPSLVNASVAISTTPSKPSTLAAGNPSLWGRTLDVPTCSQMVYPDGGEVWCSPTSTSMVLGYWSHDTGPCEPRVRAAVAGVYDWLYDGHGNWPFNTAYAATQGLEGYVARFTSLAQAEPWIAAGIPVVMSIAWKKGDLTGATIPSTNGHLLVLVGFDNAGNPVINDPAAATDGPAVQRTYLRSEFEPLWQAASGGTVYLIYPAGQGVASGL